jgi:hypothetical protein
MRVQIAKWEIVMLQKSITSVFHDDLSIWNGAMKFLIVNGRTPKPESLCAMCCEPIGGYLRETKTGLLYCDHKCYVGRCNGDATAYQHRVGAL